MKSPNFYAETGLNRMADRRGDSVWLAEQQEKQNAIVLPVWRTQNLISLKSAKPQVGQLTIDEITKILEQKPHLVFLGHRNGTPYFSVDISFIDDPQAIPELQAIGDFTDIRDISLDLPRKDGGLLAYSRAIAQWHKTHQFCNRCGSPTISKDGGHMRQCTNADCNAQHFPRTDMAVIMIVSSGDKIILGRKKDWPKNRFSILAGFVEPGETIEGAVEREVMEEVGIPITNIRYHSSQPWPYPSNLMLGFFAEALSDEIHITDDELAEARWFTRDELIDEAIAYRKKPHSVSIARRLISEWTLKTEG